MQSDQSPFTDLSPDTNSNKKSSAKKPSPKHKAENVPPQEQRHPAITENGKSSVRYSSTLSGASVTRTLKQINKSSTSSSDFLERNSINRAETKKQSQQIKQYEKGSKVPSRIHSHAGANKFN